jgi:hypothetical protein
MPVLTTPQGHKISVALDLTAGRATLTALDAPDTTLRSIRVSGLGPTYKKNVLAKIWDALSSALKTVIHAIDEVGFGAFGTTCRPDASVALKGGKVQSWTLGIKCSE